MLLKIRINYRAEGVTSEWRNLADSPFLIRQQHQGWGDLIVLHLMGRSEKNSPHLCDIPAKEANLKEILKRVRQTQTEEDSPPRL